jgi:hypothetical protein
MPGYTLNITDSVTLSGAGNVVTRVDVAVDAWAGSGSASFQINDNGAS